MTKTCRFAHIKDYHTTILPEDIPDASYIPNRFVNFLEIDFRYHSSNIECLDNLAFFLSDNFISSTHQLWKRIAHYNEEFL